MLFIVSFLPFIENLSVPMKCLDYSLLFHSGVAERVFLGNAGVALLTQAINISRLGQYLVWITLEATGVVHALVPWE